MFKINEIFYSIQGEGKNSGRAAIFIRFSGCNMNCDFCDTEHENSVMMPSDDIVSYAELLSDCKLIVMTGGEPLLQLNTKEGSDLLRKLENYEISIETNGTIEPSVDVKMLSSHITVSPKDESWKKFISANEMKILIDEETKYNYELIDFLNSVHMKYIIDNHCIEFFVQPMMFEDDEKRTKKNIDRCVEICLKNPEIRMSVQIHKFLGVK